MENQNHNSRGREANRPREIPKLGWRDILKRTKTGLSEENASIIAAGVAFYAFLSIPALLTALVSIYGLIADPAQVQQQMSALQGVVPAEGLSIISSQLTRVSEQAGNTLTLALIGSIGFALWSGSNSIRALIGALNIAYEEKEKRGPVKLYASSLLMTLGAVVVTVLVIVLVVAVTALAGTLNFPELLKSLITVARWPVLALVALSTLAAAYHYLPSRTRPRWQWVSWGAAAATLLWLGASALFSWYVSSFGNYNKTYGSLAAIVVLLMWLYISALIIIFGAKLNAEIEHQTSKDMADTVGRAS
ncbi:MAG TPA: hypothetical protein DCS07_09460 [Bdellovibrionales bacterium]|nr:MAG: hypothetical protein A2Z97_05335 [Bdellovibrionales bacterium GWB1_52_6]OFZ05696.1 MAG: hypothetical protein A2X97_03240 [Bdellovibrionales bacterium GWA1_52_35]OFZ40647.1 MAG: hypothetical protein A2070_06250 [Bdellovibrionales bacterium GWC1_52_8]HAR42838.1 hypothetical protein [Bdellovibrionales bacterium]HCM40370.1 hypothetical protein [Bdellovibrionales bacterium]